MMMMMMMMIRRRMVMMMMMMITQSVCPNHSDSKPPRYPDISTRIHSEENRNNLGEKGYFSHT